MKYAHWVVMGDLVWERWSYISDIDHLVGPIPRQLKCNMHVSIKAVPSLQRDHHNQKR